MHDHRFLSIVIPAFNEEANIALAVNAICGVISSLSSEEFEIILVDDGSTDSTFSVMAEIARNDMRVRAMRLSRNFGSHVAISAGLEHASGDAAIVTTADMEEPADALPRLLEKWQAGFEIVWGVREKRAEPFLSRLSSTLFHLLFRWLGLATYLPEGIGGGLFLVDRKVLRALHRVPERNRSIIGLLMWMGFRQTTILYSQHVRASGRSKWTVAKKLKLAVDSFTAFSYKPIRAVSLLGIMISMISVLYAVFIIVSALIRGVTVEGWPTLMVTVLFLGGLQFLVTGMMGEYLWRALDEARQRPLYIIADSIRVTATDEYSSDPHSPAIKR